MNFAILPEAGSYRAILKTRLELELENYGSASVKSAHAFPISLSARRKSASISMQLYIAYRKRSAMSSSEEYLGRFREKKQVCAFGRYVSGEVLGPSPTAA